MKNKTNSNKFILVLFPQIVVLMAMLVPLIIHNRMQTIKMQETSSLSWHSQYSYQAKDLNDFETITGCSGSTDLSEELHLWSIHPDFCDVCPFFHERLHGVYFMPIYNFTLESVI
jgi:hypothetical protein